MTTKAQVIKRMGWNMVIFAGLIALTFWFVFRDQDIGRVFGIITEANVWWILVGVGVMLLHFMVEAYNVMRILHSFGENIGFWQSLKFALIGFFFCAITPGASGGQPMEIYYMTKEKISGANATMALMIQVCGVQVAIMVLGVLGALICPEALTGGALWLFWIGFVINGVALVVLLVCVLRPQLARRIVEGVLGVVKFAGVKRLEVKRGRIEEGLRNYEKSSRYIKEHKGEFVMAILRAVVQTALMFGVTYCVYLAFGLEGMNIFQVMAMQAILYMGTSAMPIPGAVGISETLFLATFGAVFGAGLLDSAMLLVRGVSFYWFVILGMVVVFINAVRMKNVKGEIDKELQSS